MDGSVWKMQLRQDAAGASTSTKLLSPSEGFGLLLFSGLDLTVSVESFLPNQLG